MTPNIRPQALADAVQAALADAHPSATVDMLKAQLPHLEARVGAALLRCLVDATDAAAWGFTDAELDRWPAQVAARALACVRALATGEQRVTALCRVARRLTRDEQREALDGILDGTLPAVSFEHAKPRSNAAVITYLVRASPEAWQDEWIAARSVDRDGRPDLVAELLARRELERFPEAALRRIWSQLERSASDHGVPSEYLLFAARLPDDLKAQALARVRACASASTRLLHLAAFDNEVSDRERRELVETPWNPHTRDRPRQQAEHLERVAAHVPRVPLALRRRWLDTVLRFGEDYDLQRGLMALLPALSGADHRRAVDALVGSVVREGGFATLETRWDLVPDEAIEALLQRLREDAYCWRRVALIAHLIAARDPVRVDRWLQPLLDALPGLGPDHRVELVEALAPWLAARSDGAVPRALSTLSLPTTAPGVDPRYTLARGLERESE